MDGDYTTVLMEVQARLVPGSCTYGLTGGEFVSKKVTIEGPISYALGFVSRTSSALTKVPELRGVFSPLASVAHHGGEIAKTMGLAVSTDPRPIAAVSQTTGGSRDNFDVQNQSIMMAASAMNNRGIVAPFTNGETDECSFYQMGQRPVTVALYSMAATDTVGTNLIHRGEVAPVVVDPCWVDLYNWVEGEILTCPAPAYIALPFDYWGGTMRYRVSVVASKYHSGRVRMVYEPDPMQDFNATKTLGASVYCF